jgi:hypothetical protein
MTGPGSQERDQQKIPASISEPLGAVGGSRFIFLDRHALFSIDNALALRGASDATRFCVLQI